MTAQPPERTLDATTAEGAAELEAHVQCRLGGQVRDFRVVVVADGLVLRGRTRTYYAKQLAQHAVMGASPVHIVANEIEVF